MLIPPTVIHKPFHAGKIRDSVDNYVVIHYDSGPDIATTLKYLHHTRNSYHYIISKSGIIYKLIDPKFEANHAGPSFFDGHAEMNHFSIGICLQGLGTSQFTKSQYLSLSWLLDILKKRYPDLTEKRIVGHSDVAVPFGRKKDPGQFFDWEKLDSLLSWMT